MSFLCLSLLLAYKCFVWYAGRRVCYTHIDTLLSTVCPVRPLRGGTESRIWAILNCQEENGLFPFYGRFVKGKSKIRVARGDNIMSWAIRRVSLLSRIDSKTLVIGVVSGRFKRFLSSSVARRDVTSSWLTSSAGISVSPHIGSYVASACILCIFSSEIGKR